MTTRKTFTEEDVNHLIRQVKELEGEG
jgi:hypothetical protein